MSEFVLDFFEGKNLATIEKKKHSYLMIDGHDQADIYILKDGIVKTSIILSDGREFNIMYLKGFDVLSLLKDIGMVFQHLIHIHQLVLFYHLVFSFQDLVIYSLLIC